VSGPDSRWVCRVNVFCFFLRARVVETRIPQMAALFNSIMAFCRHTIGPGDSLLISQRNEEAGAAKAAINQRLQ